MAKPKIIYVYDAICGWCFGFSPVITKFADEYKDKVEIEVISGGLKLGEGVGPINVVATHIPHAYPVVERKCRVKFGDKFLNDRLKDGNMILNSLPPAIALAIMKEKFPEKSVAFAAMLNKMYYVDGIEPEDYSAYGIYAATLGYDQSEFNEKMKDPIYIEMAYQDFARAAELGAHGFPTLLIEMNGKTEILFSGYVSYENFKSIVDEHLISMAEPW